MTETPMKAYAALTAVQVVFGLLPVIGKIGLAEFNTGTFAFLRVAGGTALLVVTAALFVGMRRLPRADLWRYAWFGLLGVALNQGLFLAGLSRTTAINAVILVATIPVFTYIFAVLAGREGHGPLRTVGILLSLAGALLIIDPRRFDSDRSTLIGNLLLAANSAAYSWFLVVSRPLAQRYRSLEFMAWVFALGAPMLMLATLPSLVAAPPVGVSSRAWWALALVVLGPTFGTYALNAYALRRVPSSTVAVFIYIQPLVTAGLAVAVLGERILPEHVAAAALVLAGVTLVARRAYVAPPAT